ncbi:RNA polymerase sigma factor [Spirosoma lituiforme]
MRSIQDELPVLWNRFKNGDAKAFGQLAQQHYGLLFNYGTKFSKDHELVKDCLQDIFLDLWKNRNQLSETAFVKAYLMTALRNRMLKAVRRGTPFESIDELCFEPDSPELTVEDLLIVDEHQGEQTQRLQQSIRQLTKRQQEIIYLRFYQHLEHEEIADLMQLSRPSVANLLHRTIKELRHKLVWSTISATLFFLSFLAR